MKGRFAAAQIEVMQNPKDNISKVERIVKEASKQDVDLIVFPEYFVVHPDLLPERKRLLEKFELIREVQRVAKEYGIFIVGSHPELEGKDLYNTAFMISDDGEFIGKHRKMFLAFNEPEIFRPGKEVKAFNTKFGKIGLLVCFDSWGPHSSDIMKKLKHQETEGVLVTIFSLKNDPFSLQWIRCPLISHSLWNNFNLVATSNVGDAGVLEGRCYKALGHSLIVCPKKGLLKEGSEDKEELLIADLI